MTGANPAAFPPSPACANPRAPGRDRPDSQWSAADWIAEALDMEAARDAQPLYTPDGPARRDMFALAAREARRKAARLNLTPSQSLRASVAALAPVVASDQRPDLLSWWRALARRELRQGNRKGAAVILACLRINGHGAVMPLPVEA